jgi:hypothetical protein
MSIKNEYQQHNFLSNTGFGTVSPTEKVDVSGNINVSSGNTYKINGINVLTENSLGSGITSSGLTSVGTLGTLNVSGNFTLGSSLILNARPIIRRDPDGNTATSLDFDFDQLTSAVGDIRFFRNTNTTGNKSFIIYRGNGTGNINHRLFGEGNSYIGMFGNTGFGITNPSEKIHVMGNALISEQIAIGGAGIQSDIQSLVSGVGSTKMFMIHANQQNSTTNVLSAIGFSNHVGNSWASQSIGSLRRGHNGFGDLLFMLRNNTTSDDVSTTDEKMRITAEGNVGIGTTNPRGKLHVHNSDILLSRDNFNTESMSLTFGSGTQKMGIITLPAGDFARGSLHFCTNNEQNNNNVSLSDSRMVVTNTGNVGIGTTNPESKLTIDGGSSYDIASFKQSTTGPHIRWINDTNTPSTISYIASNFLTTIRQNALEIRNEASTGRIVLNAGTNSINSPQVTLLSSGYLGIGTTNPISKLHVFNSTTINERISDNINDAAMFMGYRARGSDTILTAVTSGYPLTGIYGRGYNGTSYDSPAGAAIRLLADETYTTSSAGTMIDFQTRLNGTSGNRSTRMVIKNDGNVGVGTTTPAVKLQVNGAVIGTPNTYTPASAGTVTLDLGAFSNHIITHGGDNLTLANPTNQIVGSSGQVIINTNGTSRSISFGTNWKWPNGIVPSLSITDTYDVISYFVPANGIILATYVNDFS